MVWANLGWSFGFWGCKLTSFCLSFSPHPIPSVSVAEIFSYFVTHPSSLSSLTKSIMVHVYGDAGDPADHLLSYQAYWQEA